mgnify:CR=1|jgi:hypothetical protein
MNVDWNIIYVSNGHACDKCGRYEMPYIDYICDAHTDGLKISGLIREMHTFIASFRTGSIQAVRSSTFGRNGTIRWQTFITRQLPL